MLSGPAGLTLAACVACFETAYTHCFQGMLTLGVALYMFGIDLVLLEILGVSS